MGRHKHPERAQIVERLLEGATAKEAAFEFGVHPTFTAKLMNQLGYRRYYLTEEEHRHIINRRKAQQSKVA